MAIGIVAGTLVSPLPSLASESALAMPALGATLILYGGMGLVARTPAITTRREGALSAMVGYVTGAISAATGVFVVPAVPYLQALNLRKDDMVRALGLAFTVATIALAGRLWLDGQRVQAPWVASVAAIVPASIGMALGSALRRRVSERVFRRILFAGLLALGAHLMVQAFV
jgi:uncharacterized membrane protein YfcA